MDFYQLQTFYHVAKYKNFTRVGEILSISQPAVSRQIESLEHQLGLTLFHRVGRSIELTSAGKTLFEKSEQILSLVRQTRSLLEGMKNLESGSLVVGASTTIGNYFLAPVVMRFMETYPGIQVHLEIKSTKEIQERLEKNLLDIVIIPEVSTSSTLIQEPLLEDEIVLIAPAGHLPISEKDSLNEIISKTRFITRKVGSNTRKSIEQHFQKYQVPFPASTEFDSNESIKQAVISGAGVSFLSKRTVLLELELSILTVLKGKEMNFFRRFFITHHKETYPSPAVKAFISFLKNNNPY